MNGFRKNIIMDIAQFVRYKEFLLNNKMPQTNRLQLSTSNTRATFCTICNEDCICMNGKYKFQNNANNLKNMPCYKYCSENIFSNCICL